MRHVIGVLVFVLVLVPAASRAAEMEYDLTMRVHNWMRDVPLVYKTQNVKPSSLQMPQKTITPEWFGILYSRSSTTGFSGTVSWQASISMGKSKPKQQITPEVTFDIGPNGNSASCEIPETEMIRCSASVAPASCKNAADQSCDVSIVVNVGSRRR